jgi:23S rRNA pseudouridine2605 synthase
MSESSKIQKVLAGLGLTSRREAESWIKAGRLKLNGDVASLGQRIGPDDRLELDHHPVDTKPFFSSLDTKVLVFNKPVGEECSKKPGDGRTSVFSHFPADERWILVGRLDVSTSGLLLVTNNGELANRLMHPSYGVTRTYRARIDGRLSDDQIQQALNGVDVDGYTAKFDSIRAVKRSERRNHWYEVSLQTGRNREVRRLFAAIGVEVSRLLRTQFAQVELPRTIHPGQYKFLKHDLIQQLGKEVKLDI